MMEEGNGAPSRMVRSAHGSVGSRLPREDRIPTGAEVVEGQEAGQLEPG